MNLTFTNEHLDKMMNNYFRTIDNQREKIRKYISMRIVPHFLKESLNLLAVLKTDIILPSSYEEIFENIFQILIENVECGLKEEVIRGRKIKYLHESVQQSESLIPRLYLMIITGSLYIEFCPQNYREILYDLLDMVKCVQNPTRGFYLRYFLYKRLENKIF